MKDVATNIPCECVYCTYNHDRFCKLVDPIEVNAIGMCEHCEYIEIDEEILAAAKEKLHKERQARYAEWDRMDRERELMQKK